MSNCPRCGSPADILQNLAPDIQAQLAKRSGENVPGQICMTCYRGLTTGDVPAIGGGKRVGSALMQAEKAKEQRKLMLWKSRVNLIKKARALMSDRAFSEAAVAYEKYLKVLEVVFDSKPGELNPEQFKDSARTQELTVVASVYWDLMRIYDTSEKYGERQALAARKLSQFLKFTPIYPDVLKRAESFAKTAKNPTVIRGFLKSASETKGRCFVATSAFASSEAPEVLQLRAWRDEVLAKTIAGQALIVFYESFSPPFARWLDRNPQVKPAIQRLLRAFLHKIRRHGEF